MANIFTIDGGIRDKYLEEYVSGGISPNNWTFKDIKTKEPQKIKGPGSGNEAIGNEAIGNEAIVEINNKKNKIVEKKSTTDNFNSKLSLSKQNSSNLLNQIILGFYPFPSTMTDFINNDSVFNNNVKSFYDSIPCVKVRAYVPTTITNEVINFLGDAFKPFVSGIKIMSEQENLSSAVDLFTDNLTEAYNDGKEFIEKISPILTDTNKMGEFIGKILDKLNTRLPGNINDNLDNLVLKLPYVLYYALMGSKTNNIYEFPAFVKSGFMDADGTYGWNDSDELDFWMFKNSPFDNKFLNSMLAGFNVNYMPMFNPKHGKSSFAGCTISFDLFNDTADKAISNYKFIHALILNNMWIQYGFIQGPASLYDVEIVGGNRFFMCSGNFKVEYVGTLRKANDYIKNYIEESENLMIPDAYRLNLEFKSLLPNNFNTYMLARISSARSLFNVRPGEENNSIFEKLGNAVEIAYNEGSSTATRQDNNTAAFIRSKLRTTTNISTNSIESNDVSDAMEENVQGEVIPENEIDLTSESRTSASAYVADNFSFSRMDYQDGSSPRFFIRWTNEFPSGPDNETMQLARNVTYQNSAELGKIHETAERVAIEAGENAYNEYMNNEEQLGKKMTLEQYVFKEMVDNYELTFETELGKMRLP